MRRTLIGVALAVAAALLAGCSGGSDGDLAARVKTLESDNEALRHKLDTLAQDFRRIEQKADSLDDQFTKHEKTLLDVRQDIVNRLKEMIQQERSGHRPTGFVRPPARVAVEPKPYMGFDGQTLTPEIAEKLGVEVKGGVVVTNVREAAPAAIAGLKQDDIVLQIDDVETNTKEELVKALEGKKPGQVITLKIVRGKEHTELKITLGRR